MFLQWVNPMQAPSFFLASYLVNNRTLAEMWTWFITPTVFFILVLALLFLYAGPGLRLEAGRAGGLWLRRKATVAGVLLVGALATLAPISAMALQADGQEETATELQAAPTAAPLVMSIDMEYTTVRAGESVFYETQVVNNTGETSPPLILAMNIINLDASGDIVDPEDWSPQRTQYIESLPAGETATHSWRVNAILDGDYMIYMVVIPSPDGAEATTNPAASPGIHLIVTPYSRLNPGGVLPFAIGGPILVLFGLLYVYRRRRQGIDEGG